MIKEENKRDSRVFFVGDARWIGVGTLRTRNLQGGNWTQPKMSYSYHPKIFKYSVIPQSSLIELEIKARNKVSDSAFINEV